MKKILANKIIAPFCLLLANSPLALGQWQTQSFDLSPGWNAIYLHIDTMHANISDLAKGTPVEAVWLWQPKLSTAQYVTNPDIPTDSKSRWASWKVGLGDASSTLKKMPGNASYLVNLSGDTSFKWNIKGKPVPAHYQWTTSGLNFLGVPALASDTTPSLEDYFDQAGDLLRVTQIFAYDGGELGPTNPGQVYGLRTTKADRGKAFWLRSGTKFNRYFGPFDLKLQSPEGVDFGENLSTYQIRLRNLTSSELTVTLTGIDSETPPNGEPAITGPAPVIIRGALDTSTLTYSHEALSDGEKKWLLKPNGEEGSEVEVVLGLDRSSMTGAAGSLYASLLRFTDSLNHSQRDIPVTGTVGSSIGLWVGGVSITQIRNTMKAPDPNNSERLISTDTESFGDVASPYPLRLIMHNGGRTQLNLLRQAFVGTLASGLPGVAVKEDLMDPKQLNTARRISCIHLPASQDNLPWLCNGNLEAGQKASVTVDIDYNDHASNPFLHTYHPDHDNLSANFKTLQPVGRESYRIKREIKLKFEPAQATFSGLTQGGRQLNGIYEETMTLYGLIGDSQPNEKKFAMKGIFEINRITDISTLTTK